MLSLCILIIIIADINFAASEGVLNEQILNKTQTGCSDYMVTDCIMQIAKSHISCNSLIYIISSDEYPDSFLRSISNYHCFSIITRSFAKRDWFAISDAYFIVANNITDFLIGLEMLSKDLSWNPAAKFALIFKDIKRHEITEIFEKLLQKLIYNVLLFANSEDNEFEVFTYYPYSANNCGNIASDVRSFGYCPNFTENNLYPDKMPNGLKNCTLIVAAKEDIPFVMLNNSKYSRYLETGVEQFLLKTIAEYEGFHLEYIYVDPKENFGVILPNHTGTGLVGYLQRNEVNIIAGGLFLMENRLRMFDYIYGYSYVMYCIFTPVWQEQKWVRVYQQFSSYTWLLIVLSFMLIVLVILIIQSLTSKRTKDEFVLVLKLWRYFYGQADVRLFKDRHVRRILIVWIFYTNFIYAFYNTALYSLITRHVQNEIQIDPKNPTKLPLKPCISDMTRTYFLYAYNEVFPKTEDTHYIECQNVNTIFESVANRTDLYTVETDYSYMLRAVRYVDINDNPKINRWDYPRSIVVTMYVRKGFPLKRKFEDYAVKIYEKGLLQRHLSSVYSKRPKIIPTLQKKYSVIRLVDFKIHFSMLIIGATISFVCFLMELKP